MTIRHYNDISRVNSFLRNALEARRIEDKLMIQEQYRDTGAFYAVSNFADKNNDSKIAADIIKQYTDTKIHLLNGKTNRDYECLNMDDIIEYVRDYAKEYIKTNRTSKKKFAAFVCADYKLLCRFLIRQTNSRPIANKIIKAMGIRIRCTTLYNVEKGYVSRHKRSIKAQKRKRTESVQKQEYKSEYKAQIKRNLTKLWPYG